VPELARQKPRYGYRRLRPALSDGDRNEADPLKTRYRVWHKREGLTVRRLREASEPARGYCHTIELNQEWALDFTSVRCWRQVERVRVLTLSMPDGSRHRALRG